MHRINKDGAPTPVLRAPFSEFKRPFLANPKMEERLNPKLLKDCCSLWELQELAESAAQAHCFVLSVPRSAQVRCIGTLFCVIMASWSHKAIVTSQ